MSWVSLIGLVAMARGVAQPLHLGGEEFRRVVGPVLQGLAGRVQADAEEVRHRLAARHQQLDAGLGGDRRVLVAHDRTVDHPGGERLVAVGIGAHGGELHVAHRNSGLLQHGARHQLGEAAGRRHRDRFALEVGDRIDLVAHEQAVRHDQPVAADHLDVGAARGGDDRAAAGRPRTKSSSPASVALSSMRVGLERNELELEPELLAQSRACSPCRRCRRRSSPR